MFFYSFLGILILLLFIFISFYIGYKLGIFKRNKYWEENIDYHRKDAINRSRAVLGGQFSEQLAPFLPDFRYSPTECKFIGKPIDLIVFEGLDNNFVNEIVFLEVKSGKSKLSKREKSIKQAIDEKRIRWEKYDVPEDLIKNKDIL